VGFSPRPHGLRFVRFQANGFALECCAERAMRPYFLRVALCQTHFILPTFLFGLAPTWGAEQKQASDVTAPNANVAQATPPALEHFESAIYPTEASQAGLEATVTLRLDIDAGGRVTAVKVVESAGHGFDEAAVDAARRFTFSPARRGELPVASRILYRYAFTLSPKPENDKPATPAAPETGELRGAILGGDPPAAIAGAEVRAQGADGQSFRALTDATGHFTFPHMSAGEYIIHVETKGFEPVVVNESVNVNQATDLKYTLVPKQQDEFEVTVHGAAVHREVTHYALSRRELLRVPGTFGDAVHSVEAMPSVARAPAFSGDLIVRGSAPQDTQVFVDGTLVPRVFHYGSLSSVVPSEMIETLQFYPSNFSVRYGRGMGGIVELGLRQTNADGKYHGSAQMDFINLRANAEGPIPALRGWSFMAGGRISYVDRWLVPVLRSSGSAIEGMPRYSDYQMYLERKLRRNGVIRIGFFGAQDKYVPIKENPTDWRAPTDAFGHMQAIARIPLSTDVNLRASWSMGRINSNSYGDDGRLSTYSANLATARTELSAATGQLGIARIGADLFYAPFKVGAVTDVAQSGGVLASADTGAPSLRSLSLHGVFFRPAAFAEYEFAPSARTNVTAGVRLDYTKDTSEFDVAPRIAARQAVTNSPYSPILKSGIGLFYQPPQPGQTLPEIGNPELQSQRALHSMVGVEQPLSKLVTASVEAFDKEFNHLISRRTDGSGNTTTENSGTGRAYGLDLLLRYRPDARFFGWVAYTLSRSTRQGAPDQLSRLFIYDETHILNVLGSYQLGRGWELGARFRYMTGFLYGACAGGLFDNSIGTYRCYGPRTQRRLAPFHQLDLRVEKTWTYEHFKVSAYMDVINAYFHNSEDYAIPKYDYSGVKTLSLSLPLLPSFGVRGEF
jgi:TonB family protein